MKILFIMRSSVFTGFGGAELQVDLLTRLCEENGIETHHAFDYGGEPPVTERKTVYHFLPDRGGDALCGLNAFHLARLMDRVAPDVVYQRSRTAYTGIAAFLCARHGVPMIYNVASDSDCGRIRVPLTRAFLLNAVNEHISRYGVRKAHTIVAQTRRQQQLLQRNLGRAGVVLPTLARVPGPPFAKTEPPMVLWLANLKQWKQPEIFLRLAEACGDLQAEFVFAGRTGSRDYHRKLVAKAKGLPNVRYLGELPYAETGAWFARASVFVNTSLPDEGYPNTYVQAWLHETPVVTLHCDPDDVLEKERLGFHARSFDALASKVAALCRDRSLAREMGARARAYAAAVHDIDKAGEKYLKLFRETARSGSETEHEL